MHAETAPRNHSGDEGRREGLGWLPVKWGVIWSTGLSGGWVVGGEVHDSNHTVGEGTGISGPWE